MAKDKKPKTDKAAKLQKTLKKTGAKTRKLAAKAPKKAAKAAKASAGGDSKLRALAQHPLVADVVAAALVATATALKNPDRARALASEAADELGKLSKAGSERGNALWEMALQIGKRSLESLGGDAAAGEAAPKRSGKKK